MERAEVTGTRLSLGAEPCTLSELRGTPLSPFLCCLTEFCRFSFPMLLHFWKQNVVLYCLPQFEPKTFFLNNFHTVWFSFPKPPCPNLPQECNAIMSSSSNMDSSVLPAEPCPTHLTISKIENPNLNIWFNFPHCPLLGRGGNGAQNSPSTMYRVLVLLAWWRVEAAWKGSSWWDCNDRCDVPKNYASSSHWQKNLRYP